MLNISISSLVVFHFLILTSNQICSPEFKILYKRSIILVWFIFQKVLLKKVKTLLL